VQIDSKCKSGISLRAFCQYSPTAFFPFNFPSELPVI
jgi:hypothetical protein